METTWQERTAIANYVREHNLNVVNENDKKVVVKESFYTKYGKRFIDIVVALVALIICSPVNFVLGICTYFDVGRPIFFLQKRPGKNRELFTIVKFRNMRNAVDKYGVPLPISQRVTKFGAFVRKASLDELLNFWSILKGDMSLIGPRPLADLYLDRYSDRHNARHAVRPGLECPNLRRRGYSVGWHERLENDVWYVENCSFLVDCKMILCLFGMVFNRKVRATYASSGVGDFLGYEIDGTAFGAHEIPDEYLQMFKECQV